MSVNIADEAAVESAAIESETYYASQGKPKNRGPRRRRGNNGGNKNSSTAGKKPHRDEVTRVANMKEFFENTEFGQKLKKFTRKTSQRRHGQPVYEVIEDLPEYNLKEGERVYLDSLHKDHLEVFGKGKKPPQKQVQNLDGSLNIEKTNKALEDNRTL